MCLVPSLLFILAHFDSYFNRKRIAHIKALDGEWFEQQGRAAV